MTKRSKTGRVSEPAVARKNMDMDVRKLEAARRTLGALTDTETVDRALDYVVMQGDVLDALDTLAALGGLEDPYRLATAAKRPRRR